MLVIDPDVGFHSTASLPTVLLGQENSSTFPVCSMLAWIETRPSLKGAVHDPAVAAVAAVRAFTEAPLSRAVIEGPLRRTAPAVPAVPATRNWRRSICPVAPAVGGAEPSAGPAAGEPAAVLNLPPSPRRIRWIPSWSLSAGFPAKRMTNTPALRSGGYSPRPAPCKPHLSGTVQARHD